MKLKLYFIAVTLLFSCGQRQVIDETIEREEQTKNQKEIAELLIDSSYNATIQEDEKRKAKEKKVFKQRFILNLDTIRSFNCNIDVLAHIDARIDSLTSKEMTYFFRTIKSDCSNNVEFSQYSNELIFKILEKYPKSAINALVNNDSEIEFSYIYLELTEPLHDLIPIDKIEKEISKLTYKSEKADSIKSALKIALERHY